jgi:hypothetical protein
MTIDQLLTDVKPLLPFGETTDGYPTVNYMPVRRMSEDQQAMFKDYLMHAANNFPEMLQALRLALMDVRKMNDALRASKMHPFTLLEADLEQALAAAEVCE